ncbi:MAG: hypothetical protein FJX66_15170 [Alphaproteobacteria bacterium]|nr:hypothetical protein [Alphaproteobacteria bacterium]
MRWGKLAALAAFRRRPGQVAFLGGLRLPLEFKGHVGGGQFEVLRLGEQAIGGLIVTPVDRRARLRDRRGHRRILVRLKNLRACQQIEVAASDLGQFRQQILFLDLLLLKDPKEVPDRL